METITGENSIFLNRCIEFARQFLFLPQQIDLYFDDCPSARFPLITNAAEINGNIIYFSKQWFEKNLTEHQADIAFFLFHELRHMHQHCSIALLEQGHEVQEPEATIDNWNYEFNNYIRNTDEETQLLNVRQEVEIDANAYGIALMRLFYARSSGVDLSISLPKEADDLAEKRVDYFFRDKPEIVSYLKKIGGSVSFSNKLKIGRNDRCPCGSGEKWKYCTCSQYH